MKTKRFLATVLTLTMIITILSAFTLTTFAADGDISLSVFIPTGGTAEITLPGAATFADLKAEMEEVFEISFEDDGYGIYCSDAKIYYDYKQPEDTKTLAELGFKSGYKVYAEKNLWTATEENPIKIFGLTITGGTGCCEPYGDYSNADYYWNYHYKTIMLSSAAKNSNIVISGTADSDAYFISKGKSYVTFDGVTMSNDSESCITLNASAKLYLCLKGNNTLTTTGGETPTIVLNNSDSKLLVYDWSDYKTDDGYGGGTLTVNSMVSGVPAIGTDPAGTAETDGVSIAYSAFVTANGGANAPGIKTTKLSVTKGQLISNGGTGSTEGINIFGTDSNSVNITNGVVKTSVIKTNLENSKAGTVVINEGADIDEIINAVVYCNVNNDTTVTNGTKYYKINNSIDTEKASVEFLAGTTTLSSEEYAKAGDVVTLAVTPADGYEISDVKVNGNVIEEIDGDYEFIMPDELAEITVAFAGDSTESYDWNIQYNAANHQAIVTAKEAGEYTVIFADYENGRLNNIDCVPITLSLGENTVSQTDTSITLSKDDKVMIWNNMTELVPACTALIIE